MSNITASCWASLRFCKISAIALPYWLSGRGIYHKTSVPTEARERIIWEYQFVYDEKLRRYFNTEEKLWELFLAWLQEKISVERITSYGKLLYQAKYRR